MKYYIHHLNDLSGSPLILRERLNAIHFRADTTLVTNHTEGFLSSWSGLTVRFNYVKHPNVILRFLSLTTWYVRVAFYLLLNLRSGDELIISTMISSPLLFVIICRQGISAEIMVNEIYFRVPLWRMLGLYMARSPKVQKIYLSRFVEVNWSFGQPSRIVYPLLRQELIQLSDMTPVRPKNRNRLKFFMVCSQIEAKGYRLFIDVAKHFASQGAQHTFHLYLSGGSGQFEYDYPASSLPPNIHVIFNDPSPNIFLHKDIFLGLTNPTLWLETFGLTFAEAMMMSNIVVVPNKGAHLEYIEDGLTGFLFQIYSVAGIVAQIERVLSHNNLEILAQKSRQSIRRFYGVE